MMPFTDGGGGASRRGTAGTGERELNCAVEHGMPEGLTREWGGGERTAVEQDSRGKTAPPPPVVVGETHEDVVVEKRIERWRAAIPEEGCSPPAGGTGGGDLSLSVACRGRTRHSAGSLQATAGPVVTRGGIRWHAARHTAFFTTYRDASPAA